MAEKRYAKNVSIILGISVVLLLFVFVLVAHHRHVPDRIRQDSSALLDSGSSWTERIKPVGQDNAHSAGTEQKPK
jgi:hypothetical protein